MSKIILILGILLATSYFGDTDNLPDSGTKISKNAWFPAIPADSAFSKDAVGTNNRDKRSMTDYNIHADENNNDDYKVDDDDDDEEMNRKNYKTKRCRGPLSLRKIKLYKEPEEEVVSYAIKNPRSLDSLDPGRKIIFQMAEDKQVSSEESDEDEKPYLRIAAVKNPKTILKNILRSKSMQRYEETEINRDNAILKRVKTHLRPEDCNVLALIGKRAGNTRPNKPRKFVCYYEGNNCGNNPGQMVLQAYPMWKKTRPIFLGENNYGTNAIQTVQQNHQFQKIAQAPVLKQYSQPSVLTKSQNPTVGSQIISGTLKTQSGAVLTDTGNGVQKQQFENIKNPLNIQYEVPSGKINWQQFNKMAPADRAVQQNGFVGQQIKSHASMQAPFMQNYIGTSYSANNVIDQSNKKMLNQQHPMDEKIEDEYAGIEQTVPRDNKKSWSISRTELGKSFRNVEDCIKLYGREFCVVDAKTLSQWKNDAVHDIGFHSEDGHLSTDYSDRNILNCISTPVSANYGYHNEGQMVASKYQYDSMSPITLTQFQYTSEQPVVAQTAQTAQNKIITGSDESYETVATDFAYSTDHNEEHKIGSNYQYGSTSPEILPQFESTSKQPFVSQTAQNKIITGSDESYETVATDYGYSTDHNEEQTIGSNYEYNSKNPENQLKYTLEQPFVAQTAQNKIITGSDESTETVATDFAYSTDHNEEHKIGSNYQYDSSTNPETLTHLQYTSDQPFVAEIVQNKNIKESDNSYQAVTTDFRYSPEKNFIGQTSNYNLENNSERTIQENHVQQYRIDKNSNIDTSDYYDNTGSQNSHMYQYEDNSVHNNNNMKYNDLSHDTYGYTTQKYLLGLKSNLHSDSRHHIVDGSIRMPVTPYENDHSFYTTLNNVQYYNDYSSDDKNNLKYPVTVSDDIGEFNYADNTEPYTGSRYYSEQPEYNTMTKMPQIIEHGGSVKPSVIIDTESPSLTQAEPALLKHSTYLENTIKRPLETTNNQYQQIHLSRPSYDYVPSYHYTNMNYMNDQLNNHQLEKAYTTQDIDNGKYLNRNYNYNYPNFYDTRMKNIWENSERILKPGSRNEHIAPGNILREMSEVVQEHQSPGPEWDLERFSSVENSTAAAADRTEIIEITKGYSFVDNDFDKAYEMHTSNPISSNGINDGKDQFNPKFTDMYNSHVERQPQDILGHVASMDSLEKFVDSTSNVLQSLQLQTDGPDDVHSLGDSMGDSVEMENSATEVTSAESTETPHAEGDSSGDLGEEYSPSVSVDLTSPRSREYFITGTGEEGNSAPPRDLVGQSLHEESTERSVETEKSKDLDLKNTGNIKSAIYTTEATLKAPIDLLTDQEPTLIPDVVGEYFGEGSTNINIDSHDILESVNQNSDMVNFTPTENVQSITYGTEEGLITLINLPKDEGLTAASDIIGKPLSHKVSKENTDFYDTSEPVAPNIETADITLIGNSFEDNKDIMESNNRDIEPAMIGNPKCSVINNEKMFTTKAHLPDDKNYLKATIKSVINNFASNTQKDMVGNSKNSKSLEISSSEDLLPEIISTPMLKTLFALPDVENTLADMVKDTLSKSPYRTKYRSFLESESNAIKSVLRDVIAELENSLPTDYPIAVEEHEFKGGKWVTEQVTLLPTVPVEQRLKIPFSETVNKIILRTLKNVVTSPMLGSKATSHPVVKNVIVETVKNALRKADVNTASIEDSTLRVILDKLIEEMKVGIASTTKSSIDPFDSSVSILGQSIDENTKISMTDNNSDLEKWTTTDTIQTQIEHPENLSTNKISENNDKVTLLTSTDNFDEKSCFEQTVATSDYDVPKESSLHDKTVSSHVLSTNLEIDDAFSSSAHSIIINDEEESQTTIEAEDYKMLGEINKEQYHHFSSESNDESPLKSVQSQNADNTQVDDSVEENIQAAHSIPGDNDFPLKTSQGSDFDKVQIDTIQENVQEAHSNPIASSSVISEYNELSKDTMISHTSPKEVSVSSEEIIDDALTVTEYPNLSFGNEHTEHILGMTEKLPTNNYNDLTSISNAESSNNSPAVSMKTIEKMSSNSEVTDVNDLLETAPIKYYSPNDRILEYKKNHLQYWNTESVTNIPLGNDMVKGTETGPHKSCSYSTIRKNDNDYDDSNDAIEKMNSAQYNNNESQTNEYVIGNNREIIRPDEDRKVNQEMIKSETSSAILESTMDIMPDSKVNDYDDTESQTENNLQQFTSDGIVGLREPQDATEVSENEYMDINLNKSGTEDVGNEEYVSSVSEKNIQSDSRFEDTQEKNVFDETAVSKSLDEETFGHVQDDSRLTATQGEDAFFETTIKPSSSEEKFVQPEQYDESEMTTDVTEEETSRSEEHVNLRESKESEKSLGNLNDSEEVRDADDMSKMMEDISDEEISKSEEHTNLAEGKKSEKSLETFIDSKEMNDLDSISYGTAETGENLNTATSPILNNDDYDLAKSQEYLSKMENTQGETYGKNWKQNLEHSTSQYLGASNGNADSIENIQMEKDTQMGISDMKSSSQNKMVKLTRRKEKVMPTKSHEIITKTIQKTITKTTKYFDAEDSIEDTTVVGSPNDEIVSATKTSCFSNSDHDLTYFGKLLPKCGRNRGNDISELTNSDLYYVGDGVRLPLTIKKLDDGSYGLSISEKVCQHFMNTKCPCCVPRDGTIVSEKRNSHDGRNMKRDLWKLSKKSSVEGELDSNEEVPDEVVKSITRYTRSTPAAISEIQNTDGIVIPERHSTSLSSMPVDVFAKKYNLILDLAKRSVTENVQKTETDSNKSILNNDKEIEREEKMDLTETEDNFSNIFNASNGNKIFDRNHTSNLVKSLIAVNDAPESKRVGIVINALENLIRTEPTEIYMVVDGQEKKVETLNMKLVEEDADATQDEEIAKYGYQKDNPILGRIKFIKAKQKEQSQHKYQRIDDNDVTKKMEILKVILYWLKDAILRIPMQNKS